MSKPDIHIWCDGACSPNPGLGGWAAVVRKIEENAEQELFGSCPATTNNRMELTACIEALKTLTAGCRVTAFVDSKYVMEPFTKNWIAKWAQDGWMRGSRLHKPIPNADLWQELLGLVRQHQVIWVWVKGHDTNANNIRCDALALNARLALADTLHD